VRSEAFDLCKELLERFGADPQGRSIDVGGAPWVMYDEMGQPNPILDLNREVEFLDPDEDKGAGHKIDFLDAHSILSLQGKYDIVYCFDTLEHIPDPFLFCKHLLEITKIGGYVFVATVFRWPYHPSPEDYWRFTPSALRLLFTESEILWCDWNGPHGVALLARRVL